MPELWTLRNRITGSIDTRRWRFYEHAEAEAERRSLRQNFSIIDAVTGKRVLLWVPYLIEDSNGAPQ